MKISTRLLTAFFLIIFGTDAYSQVVKIKNKSFEGIARRGQDVFALDHWTDCGPYYFRGESPPDVHPNKFWENTIPASNGDTYVGLVVRPSGTYEFITQELGDDIEEGTCYAFSIDMAISPDYWSAVSQRGRVFDVDTTKHNFKEPVVLRVWGSQTPCYSTLGDTRANSELLASSVPVNNHNWQEYIFTITPKKSHKYITLEAFFRPEMDDPYTGHILIDNASHLFPIPCDDEMAIVEVFNQDLNDLKAYESPLDPKNKVKKKDNIEPPVKKQEPKIIAEVTPEVKEISPPPPSAEIQTATKKAEPKILTELDAKTLKKGQIINVKKLFFEADTSSISEDSYTVLDEISSFLLENTEVNIEVGGHTNGTPSHEYCDRLSTARAKTVATYLVRQGVPPDRISFKGYGKRSPIASNKTASGRAKNQRVEIKILSIGDSE